MIVSVVDCNQYVEHIYKKCFSYKVITSLQTACLPLRVGTVYPRLRTGDVDF